MDIKSYAKNFIVAFKEYPKARNGILLSLLALIGCFVLPYISIDAKLKTGLSFLFVLIAYMEGDMYFKTVTALNVYDEETKNKGKKKK